MSEASAVFAVHGVSGAARVSGLPRIPDAAERAVPRRGYRGDSRYGPARPYLPLPGRFLLPFFCGVLAAMNLGAYAASRLLPPPPESVPVPLVSPSPEPAPPAAGPEISSAFLEEPEPAADLAGDAYLDSGSREWVVSFFTRLCGSAELAEAILEGAALYAIPPGLSFALCWEESRYNPRAVNRLNRDGSVDRGLFQLNSGSFPKLTEYEFFNPRINAVYGMAHLRLCLDTGGSEITALAMYNAGTTRVRAGGTPRQTLDYTARVLAARRKIDRVFLEEWTRLREREEAGGPATAAGEPGDTGESPPAPPALPAPSASPAPPEIAAPDGSGAPRPFLLRPLSR